MEQNKAAKLPEISFGKAVIAIVVLVVILFLGFAVLDVDTKVVFTVASVAIGITLVCYGFKMNQVFQWFIDGAKGAMDVILILMAVGTVIGTWIISGTIPTIIYYGLSFLTPSTFMISGFALCCIVSFFIGSSYSTLATMGVALMGIGMGMGVNPAITAGVVLSGSLFGDKMSPFSDTTNMAPAVSGTTVYRHINSMLYTTVPAMVLTVIIYLIIGGRLGAQGADLEQVELIKNGLQANFHITPVLFIIPVLTVAMMLIKLPPVIALLGSAFIAVIFGLIFQGEHSTPIEILSAIGNGYSGDSGVADIDRLMNRGGIGGMMETVAWTILTLGMGQMLKESGIISAFLDRLLVNVKKPRGAVLSTLLFSLITSMLTASQYLAIMLPGMMLKDKYEEVGLEKRVLSRTLEDGGTMFSFLVPWDTAGIYTSSVLGVATLAYAPFACLLYLCPIIAAVYACTGFALFKEKKEAAAETAA